MSLTLVEVCDKLKTVDEITLMERLEITSEEIVERFVDVIEEKYEELSTEYSAEEREYD